jgi:hypothetical protein
MKPNPAAFRPSADPVDREIECRRLVSEAGWFDVLPAGSSWPLTTDQAAAVLRDGGEYDVRGGDLIDLIDRRILPSPAMGEDGAEWGAEDVVTAAVILEKREQWLPAPSGHDSKKHPTRLALEEARRCGTVGEIVAGVPGVAPAFDVRHLLVMLTHLDSIEGRVKVATLLAAVLEHDHSVIL